MRLHAIDLSLPVWTYFTIAVLDELLCHTRSSLTASFQPLLHNRYLGPNTSPSNREASVLLQFR